MSYTRTNLKSTIASRASGELSTADLDVIINDAVRDVVAEIDLVSTKRSSSLSPRVFDDVFEYSAPSDLKFNKVVDIQPQKGRNRFDNWRMTTQEEFDRYKQNGECLYFNTDRFFYGEGRSMLVAIGNNSTTKTLLLSASADDSIVTIDNLTEVGTLTGVGDGENLMADNSNTIKYNAAINFDIGSGGGTTAGITDLTMAEAMDITDYLQEGSVFVWAYIPSTTYITNYKLAIGSSPSDYYTVTVTTKNDGNSFVNGWNLLRFDLINGVETGSVDNENCDYWSLYMTKNALKINESNYRFSDLFIGNGQQFNVIYYSNCGWKSATGTYLEDATTDTDILNVSSSEYGLIVSKCLEYAELRLQNPNMSNQYNERYYKILKPQYEQNNPSEALLMTETYWDFDNYGY